MTHRLAGLLPSLNSYEPQILTEGFISIGLGTPAMSTDPQSPAATIAKAAKAAFEASQLVPSTERVNALHEIRKELEAAKAQILEANRRDLEVRRRSVGVKRTSSDPAAHRQPKQKLTPGICLHH